MKFYLFTVLAMLAGTGTHILKKVVELRKEKATFSLRQFITENPYKTALTVMAGVGGYFGFLSAGELTLATAFMAGYMADSLSSAAK